MQPFAGLRVLRGTPHTPHTPSLLGHQRHHRALFSGGALAAAAAARTGCLRPVSPAGSRPVSAAATASRQPALLRSSDPGRGCTMAPLHPPAAAATITTTTTTTGSPPPSAVSRLAGIANHLSSSPSPSSSTSLLSSLPSLSRSLHTTPSLQSSKPSATMSTQPDHSTLLIPGPIEFDDAVLQSMSHYSESHVGPAFVSTFGDVLTKLRKLFQSTDPAAQPFVLSGSGTLGWDLVSANLVEAGEDVLVLGTGYFSNGLADCLRVYGAKVTELTSPVGTRPQLPEIEAALKAKSYKAITVTHVDTSTGVLSELKDLSALVHRVSPDTLIIVDGVCSVACEEIAFDEWKLDAVVTASQKAIGVPAGLSISFFSGRAIKALESRKTPPAAYFASMKNWLPIMRNYEAKKASYFATPSPQLVHALNTALDQILSVPLATRFAKHKEVSDKIKNFITKLGLKQVAANPADQAHGMTAIYLPETVAVTQILPSLSKKNVVFAGGIHKEIATKYIRFGHMGVSVLQPERGDIDRALKALEDGLAEFGYTKA